MRIEIDQSEHVEYTTHDTVVADSLGNTLYIRAKDKRFLQKLYREAGKPRIFVLELFSLLITVLIQQSFVSENQYVIDMEYPGRDHEIKRYVLFFAEKLHIPLDASQISFGYIGKRSKAHGFGYERYKKKRAGTIMTLGEVLATLLP